MTIPLGEISKYGLSWNIPVNIQVLTLYNSMTSTSVHMKMKIT